MNAPKIRDEKPCKTDLRPKTKVRALPLRAPHPARSENAVRAFFEKINFFVKCSSLNIIYIKSMDGYCIARLRFADYRRHSFAAYKQYFAISSTISLFDKTLSSSFLLYIVKR